MPRFVILTHDWPFPHWDLLLEAGGSLRSWRLLAEPEAGDRVSAEAIPDHRLHYLDYEGPVSGNRGTVTQWDSGVFELLSETVEELTIQIAGRHLQGAWQLRKTAESLMWEFCRAGII